MTKLISVGILTRNAGASFADTLHAIRSQRCYLDLEIVLLDSCSTDGTRELARGVGAKVHTLEAEKFSFGSARDRLFSLCRGEIIVTISQDCRPKDDGWLFAVIDPILRRHGDIVCGAIDCSHSTFYWERERALPETRGWTRFVEQHGGVGLSCANLAVRRQVWESIRFGPIPMCEDKLFQKRAHRQRFVMLFRNDAAVLHAHNYRLMSLVRRSANEGMGLHYLGEQYGFRDMVAEMLSIRMWTLWFQGLCQRKLRSSAELLFPILRPAAMWYGNHYLRRYWDE